MSDKQKLYVASFSGGKDSTAMVLKLIQEKWPLDIILFCDTGLEFPGMYKHIDQVEKDCGMKITRVKSQYDFDYLLTEHKHIRGVRSNNIKILKGFGWPISRMRWCTGWLKDEPIRKYFKSIKGDYEVIQYIGVAADETKRLERARHQARNKIFPLVEWNMTEADCLKFCIDRGYTWDGLYDQFKRVSCWCCSLQPLESLRTLYFEYPELWKKMDQLDEQSFNTFKQGWSVKDLAVRFEFEKEWQNKGGKLRTRAFFQELYKRVNEEREKRMLGTYPDLTNNVEESEC